jgi:hypothetical protein
MISDINRTRLHIYSALAVISLILIPFNRYFVLLFCFAVVVVVSITTQTNPSFEIGSGLTPVKFTPSPIKPYTPRILTPTKSPLSSVLFKRGGSISPAKPLPPQSTVPILAAPTHHFQPALKPVVPLSTKQVFEDGMSIKDAEKTLSDLNVRPYLDLWSENMRKVAPLI